MLVLHVEADTHQELVSKAIKTLGIAAVEALPATDAPAATLPAPAPHTPRAPRKPRTTTPPPAAVAPSSPAPAASSPEAPIAAATPVAPQTPPAAVAAPVASGLSIPTIDELRAALGEVNSLFGMAVCTGLLADFGAQRVSLVPEDKRAEFIKECKARVAKNSAEVAASKAAKA